MIGRAEAGVCASPRRILGFGEQTAGRREGICGQDRLSGSQQPKSTKEERPRARFDFYRSPNRRHGGRRARDRRVGELRLGGRAGASPLGALRFFAELIAISHCRASFDVNDLKIAKHDSYY